MIQDSEKDEGKQEKVQEVKAELIKDVVSEDSSKVFVKVAVIPIPKEHFEDVSIINDFSNRHGVVHKVLVIATSVLDKIFHKNLIFQSILDCFKDYFGDFIDVYLIVAVSSG